ncbi:MAG: LysR family transcriptional regulator [Gemmataceae bacterium]|nr:LysR family transcriptional regulator [Gemmataceae bacterium]
MARRYRYKDIQLPQLRSFCVAATEGNFTAAARALGLSAPTVWEQVRGLERRLGATLLLRKGRKVELTAEGRVLLNLIQPHVSGIDSLERLFDTQRADLPRRLTVASTPHLLAHHLITPVQEFAALHPTVAVRLRPSVRLEDGLQLVERGQADLGIQSYLPEESKQDEIEFEHLFDMKFMLVTAVGHPLARKRQVTARDVVKYPLVMQQEGSLSRKEMERILRRDHLLDQARAVVETSHFDVIRSYVAAGIGISLLYTTLHARRFLPDLHLRVFDPEREGLPVALLLRKGAHHAAPVNEFCRIVRRCLATDD